MFVRVKVYTLPAFPNSHLTVSNPEEHLVVVSSFVVESVVVSLIFILALSPVVNNCNELRGVILIVVFF